MDDVIESSIRYIVSGPFDNVALAALFEVAWPGHGGGFSPLHCPIYVCAYSGVELVGFVKVATDGGVHGFLLDTVVHPDHRRRGIGIELVRRASEASAAAGYEWLHVDCEPHLEPFYAACGFRPTDAGLMRLTQ